VTRDKKYERAGDDRQRDMRGDRAAAFETVRVPGSMNGACARPQARTSELTAPT